MLKPFMILALVAAGFGTIPATQAEAACWNGPFLVKCPPAPKKSVFLPT